MFSAIERFPGKTEIPEIITLIHLLFGYFKMKRNTEDNTKYPTQNKQRIILQNT